MKKFYFLFIILFIQSNSQIKQNPIFLVESIYPFVLSTNDNYYYVITLGKNLKINKESGILEDISDNGAVRENYIFVADNSYNNWVYYSKAIIKLYMSHFFHTMNLLLIKIQNIKIWKLLVVYQNIMLMKLLYMDIIKMMI